MPKGQMELRKAKLPPRADEVALKLYTDFVYRKFMHVFRRFFSIYKENQYVIMNTKSTCNYRAIERDLQALKNGTLLKDNI